MSLKGRGQGVDLGTSTLSLIRSIIFSFLGLTFPYDPLNLFPFFVFLSPRPHTIGAADGRASAAAAGRGDASTRLATAPHHCIVAIFCSFSLLFRWSDDERVNVAILTKPISFAFWARSTGRPTYRPNVLITILKFIKEAEKYRHNKSLDESLKNNI